MTGWLSDFRFGMRLLRSNPEVTFVAVLAMAIAIGIAGTMFSVVNAVLIQPLPFAQPERLVAVWQGLLLGGAVAGLTWLLVLIVAGIIGALRHTTFSNVALLPWIAVMIAAILLLGWLTASGCMTLVARTADRERAQAEHKMRAEIAEVARRMVLVPVEQELSVYGRFRDELAVARGEA